jgi:nucleoside-diphosphate-sugar epimerase
VTIQELADRVRVVTRSESELTFVSYDEVYGQGIEDMLHRQPNIAKVTEAIGWTPSRSLDDILRDVVAFTRTSPAIFADA